MNKNKLIFFVTFLTIGLLLADPPNWDANGDGVLDNYNDYENNGSVTAKVYPNGIEGGEEGEGGALLALAEHVQRKGAGFLDQRVGAGIGLHADHHQRRIERGLRHPVHGGGGDVAVAVFGGQNIDSVGDHS